MNKRERLQAAVDFQPVDRIPVSAWGHFLGEEMDPAGLADTLYEWHRQCDFDFLKIQPRASYQVEGWGYQFTPSTANGTAHTFVDHPIKSAEDWLKLEPLDMSIKPLADQLELARILRDKVGPDTPLLMTVFATMDMAEKIVNRDPALLRHYLDEAPEAVDHALGVLGETYAAYVRELVAIGVDGIFVSSRWTNPDRMSHADYIRMARPRDLKILEPARQLPFNTVHLCGGNIGIELVKDYPVGMIHWDQAVSGNPTMKQGQDFTGKAVCGGVQPKIFHQLTPAQIREAVHDSVRETGGKGYIASPGCTAPIYGTAQENFDALVSASHESMNDA